MLKHFDPAAKRAGELRSEIVGVLAPAAQRVFEAPGGAMQIELA
jgi:hypothetical protein